MCRVYSAKQVFTCLVIIRPFWFLSCSVGGFGGLVLCRGLGFCTCKNAPRLVPRATPTTAVVEPCGRKTFNFPSRKRSMRAPRNPTYVCMASNHFVLLRTTGCAVSPAHVRPSPGVLVVDVRPLWLLTPTPPPPPPPVSRGLRGSTSPLRASRFSDSAGLPTGVPFSS